MARHYRRKKRDIESYYRNESICMKCTNCYGGCSWSREFKPVDGWTATPNTIKSNGEHANTYYIIDCPEFVKDKRF